MAAGLFLVAAVACEKGETQAEQSLSAATPNVVTITAGDFVFEAPAEIPAGLTTFRLVNKGTELHHAQLFRLLEGKSVDDLLAAFQAGGPLPTWISYLGGPNAVDPGGVSNATSVLEPGHYVLACVIPSTDGVIHLAKGMISELKVVPSGAPTANEPQADLVMKLVDYGFLLSPETVTAGTHIIRVLNEGPQVHEAVVARLEPGKSMADLAAWFDGGMQAPPPAHFIGGVVGLDVGKEATFSAEFTPATYLLLCFVLDARDGREHLAHGMVKQFTVS
ncbi:MAG: hypothetical protein AMS25_00705 [Gemmatimonas sp. SM23_52]|nr:MAG: hypothetical protein AMS25_00705 [Gemmatimonas sp. SM23_52]